MSDIIFRASRRVGFANGGSAVITRVRRIQSNKYSDSYTNAKRLLDEHKACERIIHEKKNSELKNENPAEA